LIKLSHGKNVELVVFPTYELAFEAVENMDCDYAVISMENSNARPAFIPIIYLLARKFLYIVNEVYVPIHYSLIGLPMQK
jgi:prephenate dehydratase/arogenate/prephenate dehydratase